MKKTKSYHIMIGEVVSATTQQIQGAQGVTSLTKGWRRQEKEGIVFPGRRSNHTKAEYMRTTINLRTGKYVCVADSVQVEKRAKVRLEKEAGQEVIWS